MKIRKHFRTSSSTINLIVSDFTLNRIVNKEVFFKYCVNERLNLLNNRYDEKINKITSYIILHCNYDNLPLDILSKMIMSLSKVTNALTKGFISLLSK